MLSYRSGREVDLEESRPLVAGSTHEEDVRRIERISHRSSTSLWFMVGFVTLIPIITFMVHTIKPSSMSSSSLRSIANDAMRSMNLQGSVNSSPDSTIPKDIEASSSICSITTTLNHASYDCKGSYINFIVPATAEGLWPDGLTYSLYEAASDNKGLLSKFHYEQGPTNLPERTSCESFSSVLCLAGDFTLNVNKGNLISMQEEDVTDADRNSMYVDICGSDHRVHAGESYKFSTYNIKCASVTDSGMIPISNFQRNITSTIGIDKTQKSINLLDSVTNYFHEIFDPQPVTDEPEYGINLQEQLNPEITDPVPIADEPDEGEKLIDEVKLTDHISSTANTELTQESAVLKNSENIGQTADSIRDLILKHNKDSANFMAEIQDKNAVTEEDYNVKEDEESILAMVKKISNLSDSNEATTSTLLASSSSTVQDADALGNLLDSNNTSRYSSSTSEKQQSAASASPEKRQTTAAKSSKPISTAATKKSSPPPATPKKDGTLNPWSLNPQTGSSKVPVAKRNDHKVQTQASATTTNTTTAKSPPHMKTMKKKKRRLLGKGGVKNLEGTKSHLKQKNLIKKLKMREKVSSE